MDKLYLIVWPSFAIAAIAEIAFFVLIDPRDLYLFGHPAELSELATYSIGFFAFWVICAASSWVTRFLERSSTDINRECTHVGRAGDLLGNH